jgi:Mn-dependent DtxR family transcriptional regulator
MNPRLEQIFRNRFRIMRKLYEINEGIAERRGADLFEIGKELGMNDIVTSDTFDFLKAEGLVKWSLLGGISITQYGVRAVEIALDHRLTAYFPADIADKV